MICLDWGEKKKKKSDTRLKVGWEAKLGWK